MRSKLKIPGDYSYDPSNPTQNQPDSLEDVQQGIPPLMEAA
jgi:hypothetical protein